MFSVQRAEREREREKAAQYRVINCSSVLECSVYREWRGRGRERERERERRLHNTEF